MTSNDLKVDLAFMFFWNVYTIIVLFEKNVTSNVSSPQASILTSGTRIERDRDLRVHTH